MSTLEYAFYLYISDGLTPEQALELSLNLIENLHGDLHSDI
jgi:hypothetical protein